MQEEQQEQQELPKVKIDDTAYLYLLTATGWARTIAILGLVGSGLSFVATIQQVAMGLGGGSSIVTGVITLAFSILLNLVLLRFANQTSAGLQQDSHQQFNAGIGQLSLYFKIMGIVVLIGISLLVLVLSMGIFMGIGKALVK